MVILLPLDAPGIIQFDDDAMVSCVTLMDAAMVYAPKAL